MSRHLVIWCVLFLASCAATPSVNKPLFGTTDERSVQATSTTLPVDNTEVELYRKSLDVEREVVVVRGQRNEARILGSPITEKVPLDQVSAVSTVRVELHLKGRPPLTLASRVMTEGHSKEYNGFHVLDVLFESERLTFAAAEGDALIVWRIAPLSDTPSVAIYLKTADWTPWNAGYPRDRTNISMLLRRSGEGKLMIEVVDRLPLGAAEYQHTLFEQVEDAWKFKRVKQWRIGDDEKE